MEFDRILLDIEAQRDFFHPAGSLYTHEASVVARQIYCLFDWARANHVPVISTVLRVRVNERGPFGIVPHCVDNTDGEKKLARTILSRRINLGLRNSTDLPADIFEKYQQVIFEKRDTNIFAHARLERLISELKSATFIVCGADVAHGIAQAAAGLRNRGFSTILASDAALDLGGDFSEMARLRMGAKGVVFARTCDIVAPRPARRQRPFRTVLPTPK